VAYTSDGYYIVTPDNGSLTHLKQWVGIEEVREIDESVNRLKGKNTEDVSVFHGRDLFSYCAAKLASGQITYEEVGQSYNLDQIIMHPIHDPFFDTGLARGIFEINDPNFGNLWTNFPLQLFFKAGFDFSNYVQLKIHHDGQQVFSQQVLFEKSFGFAKKGEPMLYNNELMRVGVAVNQGSFVEQYGIGYGPEWQVEITK
jgi:S-adenosylmethionine hydrolase